MNVERLHAIAIALKSDLAQSGVPSHLQNLLSALQNQVSQPGQPQYQQQVSQFYSALLSALEKSSIDDFSPTWQQVVVELGAADLLGKNLARRIEGVFTANQITPSIASEELQKLLTRLNSLSASIDQLVTAFAQLKIGAEDLDPGECEVGVLVPRAFVDNRLDRFSDELSELNKIFGVFEELSTGSRPSLKIRTISSTDLSIFLDAAPVVGACVATAVERIVALYKNLLEIRKLQGELARQGLEKNDLKGIENHANSVMDKGIDILVKDLISEFYKGPNNGREHEVSIELKFALKKVANRVDRGFNIEVRMEEPEVVADEEAVNQDVEKNDIAKHHARIQGAAQNLQFLKLDGAPILSLPEKPEPKAEAKAKGKSDEAP